MTDAGSGGPWWILYTTLVVPACSAAWVVFRWNADRKDKRNEGNLSREEREVRAIEAQRAALTAQQAAMFDRQDAELARLRQRITDVESERDRVEEDRDRGWSIGRYWFNEAHEAAGIARNAQAVASALMKYAPPEVAAEHKGWTPLILPAFEAPYPKPKPE